MRLRLGKSGEPPPKPTPAMLRVMPRSLLSISTALTLGRSSTLFPRWMGAKIEAKHDITSGRLVLMWLLSRFGEMRMGAAAQMLDLTPRAITGQVDGLEDDGLAQRRASEEDGRVVYVSLTDKGSALISRIEPDLTESFTSLFSCLEKSEMRELIRITEKLTDHMKAQLDDASGD
jgi:DNA-binding MarR family transcriptional regulator